jgi:hypothetical protein
MKEPTFDIFTGVPNKNAVWVEAVPGLSNARARMHELAAQSPGYYFVFSPTAHAIVAETETTNKPESNGSAP